MNEWITSAGRAHYIDVLRDIADSYMNDPEQRRALVSDAIEALDDVMAGQVPTMTSEERVMLNLRQPGAFARPVD